MSSQLISGFKTLNTSILAMYLSINCDDFLIIQLNNYERIADMFLS
jgi:hypothetical protein